MSFKHRLFEQFAKEYMNKRTIDTESRAYLALKHLLDTMSQEELRKIKKANIRHVSHLAANRIKSG